MGRVESTRAPGVQAGSTGAKPSPARGSAASLYYAEAILDRCEQGFEVVRFLQEIERAQLHRFDRERNAVAVRTDDDRKACRGAADIGQEIEAMHAGQIEIEQHHALFERCQLVEKRLSRGEAMDMGFGVAVGQHAEQGAYFLAITDDMHKTAARLSTGRWLCVPCRAA